MKAALFYYEIDIFNIYLREQYEVCRVMYTFWSSYVPTFCILLMVIARGWGILGSWQCVNYRTGRSSGLHVHPSSKSCLLPLANSQPFFKVSSATQSQSTLLLSPHCHRLVHVSIHKYFYLCFACQSHVLDYKLQQSRDCV